METAINLKAGQRITLVLLALLSAIILMNMPTCNLSFGGAAATTTGATTTTTLATATEAAIISSEAVLVYKAVNLTAQEVQALHASTITALSGMIAAYIAPPTDEALKEMLDELAEGINSFNPKGNSSNWWIKGHNCFGRTAWGLMYGKKKKNKEILHFEWDSKKGELEVYAFKRGPHLGAISVVTNPGKVHLPSPGRARTCPNCN